MFQSPRKRWTWFLAPGRLADGTEIEVLRRAPLDWSQPSDPQSEQRGFRWTLYLEAAIARGVYDPPFRVTHPALLEYLCREWNARNGWQSRLEHVELVMAVETIPGPDWYHPKQILSPGHSRLLASRDVIV